MRKLSPWSELYLQAVKWAGFAGNNRDALTAAAQGWSQRAGAVPIPDVDALAELARAAAVSVPADFPETQRRMKEAIALAKAEWDAFAESEKQQQQSAEAKHFGVLPAPREIFDPVKERIDR